MPDRQKLLPATPWALEQLRHMKPDDRATLEAAIPAGLVVALSGKPPNVTAWLLQDRSHEPRQLAFSNHHSSQWAAVWAVLAAYGEKRVRDA